MAIGVGLMLLIVTYIGLISWMGCGFALRLSTPWMLGREVRPEELSTYSPGNQLSAEASFLTCLLSLMALLPSMLGIACFYEGHQTVAMTCFLFSASVFGCHLWAEDHWQTKLDERLNPQITDSGERHDRTQHIFDFAPNLSALWSTSSRTADLSARWSKQQSNLRLQRRLSCRLPVGRQLSAAALVPARRRSQAYFDLRTQ